MAVLGDAGRAVSRPTGESFAVRAWLENDGDIVAQEEAAARPGIRRDGRMARARLGNSEVLLVRGKQALAAITGCGGANILVTDQVWDGPKPCLVLDATILGRTGAVAGWVRGAGLQLVPSEALTGRRPWTCAGREPEECQPPSVGP